MNSGDRQRGGRQWRRGVRGPGPMRASGQESGSALMGTIAVILIVGVLGAGILTLVSSGIQANMVVVSGNQAFFMAESGARYAIARLLQGGEAAAADMNGRTYTLSGTHAFALAVEAERDGGRMRYFIDSTGIHLRGTAQERRTLNGYVIELGEEGPSGNPVAFNYAVQLSGAGRVTLTGSAYIDSFDSSSPATAWTSRGQYSEGHIYTAANTNAASLAWSTAIYGNLYAGPDADEDNPTTVVNRPANVLGAEGILATPVVAAVPIPAPVEPDEVPPPSSWSPLPAFTTWGTPRIPGGDYSVANDFSNGSAQITATGDTYLSTGRDLNIGGGGWLDVNGDFGAVVGRDLNIGGGVKGITSSGDMDIRVTRDLTVGGSSALTAGGNLDLDVTGDLSLEGSARLTISGDADIDVGGSFTIGGGAQLRIEGRTVIRAGAGFSLTGWSSPIAFAGPNASLLIYVSGGAIRLESPSTNIGGSPSRFVIVGGPAVTSVAVTGSAQVYGVISAPNADYTQDGSTNLFGAVVARNAALSGSAALHFDTALLGTSGGSDPLDLTLLRRHWVAAGGE